MANGAAVQQTKTGDLVAGVGARLAHAVAEPTSARWAVPSQDCRALDMPGVSAKIELARFEGEWIAEFRFRLRSGSYQACTLPLTSSSQRFTSAILALGDAASRLVASLESAIANDTLSAAQAKAVDKLRQWAQAFADAALSLSTGPLAGKRFLDVFAGIGGFHIALAALGASCAGAIEIDPRSRETYRANHLGDYPLAEDVRAAKAEDFGEVDIVCGGFPCQSFSKAGNGAGLADITNGALFFDLARLIGELNPSVAILENVAGLATHDGGNTFDTILDTLSALGYSVSTRALNAADFGLPQNRERLFLICVHHSAMLNRIAPFTFPKGADATRVVADILEGGTGPRPVSRPMKRLKSPPKTRSSKIETIGLIDEKDHQGYRVASVMGKGYTLCASSGGLGGKTGLYLVRGRPRSLSPRESARMQGFPEWFAPDKRDSQALKQLGNSVAVSVISALGARAANTVAWKR